MSYHVCSHQQAEPQRQPDFELKPAAPLGRKPCGVRRAICVIIRKRAIPDALPAPVRRKVDPGSKVTGLAVVNDVTGQVAWAAELPPRGQRMRDALLARRALRHGRRQRHTR